MVRGFVPVVVVAALALFPVSLVEARDRPIRTVEVDKAKFRAYNVGLSSFFTLASAIVQGEVRTWRDAARQFAVGVGAGFSFYQAKRMAGAGRTTEGWVLANLTTTVVENSTSGEHPLGSVGYTLGPLRLRVATPYARKAVARFELDGSLAESVFLIVALREGDDVQWRDGLIAVNRDDGWPDPDREGVVFTGRAFGIFPGVARGTGETIWHHEMVHAIQSQQIDSVEPPLLTRGGEADPARPRRLFLFRHVRGGSLHLANAATFERSYEERWNEVEAWGLAEETPVEH